jgi:hypothetical protein
LVKVEAVNKMVVRAMQSFKGSNKDPRERTMKPLPRPKTEETSDPQKATARKPKSSI